MPDGSLSGSTSYYANQLDQYVSVEKTGTSGTGSDAYSYDLNGNLAETSKYRFGYDWKDRLVRVTGKARTVLVGTGSERKEIWLGSETGSGEDVPASEPPPAEPETSSWTETPPPEPVPEPGTSSWSEVPTGTGSETWTGETSSWAVGTGSWTSETGSGKETGTWSMGGSGCVSWFMGWICDGTGNPPPLPPPPLFGTGTQSGTGSETQSGATSSWTTQSGSAVTETTYPEKLIAEYSYDPLGRRVSKTLPDRTVSYSYAGRKIVGETVSDLSGNVLRSSEFAYGASDDDVLAEFRTQSWTTVASYHLKDRLGSAAAVTDASWNVLEEYRYSAFWSPYRKLPDGTWEALGTETETFSGTVRPEPLTERLYAGREWDSETGLHHYRARAYSPELGRFLQRDPVGTADQMNPYAYVRNNPMMWTDPTGMFCALAAGKEMVKGAVLGDFQSNQNWWNIAGQVALWLTPLWWVGDARDFAHSMSKCSGWWCAWAAAIGTVAFVPLLWDAVKYWAKANKTSKLAKAPHDIMIEEKLVKYRNDLEALTSKGFKSLKTKSGEAKAMAQRWIGGNGWQWDKAWKDSVKRVANWGTHTDFNGETPRLEEALRLLHDAKWVPIRPGIYEWPHEFPNPHDFWHINYIIPRTEGSLKWIDGTIKILKP